MFDYKRTPEIVFLEKIRDGQYTPLDREIVEKRLREVTPSVRELYYIIRNEALGGRLIRMKDLLSMCSRQTEGTAWKHLRTLKERNLIEKASIVELLLVFCKYDRSYRPPWKFPNKNLEASLSDELKTMKVSTGCPSWPKKVKNPDANVYGRYIIPLESIDGKPIYYSIFF